METTKASVYIRRYSCIIIINGGKKTLTPIGSKLSRRAAFLRGRNRKGVLWLRVHIDGRTPPTHPAAILIPLRPKTKVSDRNLRVPEISRNLIGKLAVAAAHTVAAMARNLTCERTENRPCFRERGDLCSVVDLPSADLLSCYEIRARFYRALVRRDE